MTGSGVSESSNESSKQSSKSSSGVVVKFPERRKQQVTEELLNEKMDELDYLYEQLNRVHEILHTLELESSKLEKAYDEVFKRYVRDFFEDHEDMELRYFNYCSSSNLIEDEEGRLRIVFYED